MRLDPHVPPRAVRQIDRAGGIDQQRRRSQHQAAVQPTVGKRGIALDPHARHCQPLQLAVGDRARRDGARQRVPPGAIGQREIQHARFAHARGGRALPDAPATVPGDVECDRAGQSRKLGKNAAGRAARMHIHIKPVAIGLRVELERERVAARHRRVQRHDRTARSHIGLAVQAAAANHARNGLGDDQPVHVERADMNVEARQDRPAPPGRRQLRQLGEHRLRHMQAGDVEPVTGPGERFPVERRARNGEDQAVRIRYAHVDQLRLAIQRSLDPPDREAQAVGRAQGGDAIGDEAMAHAGVEDRAYRNDQRGDRQQRKAQPAQPAAPHRRALRFDGKIGLAQNACPNET